MPPDFLFITKSLSQIEESVKFLASLAKRPEADYLESMEAKFSSAYGLMTAIEGVSGVAAHIIATTGLPTPQGSADSFRVLHEAGILTGGQHCERLQQMARLRNLLVHRYWEIDYRRVRAILLDSLEDFSLFAQQILSFAKNAGESREG